MGKMGNGKGFLSCQTGKHVCRVDCDFRRSVMVAILNVDHEVPGRESRLSSAHTLLSS